MTPVLWQFAFSHYNEKVRWALDLKGIPHVRRSLLPGLHLPRILWMTGQTAVPVLVRDGETLWDSTRIIARLEELVPEPALYPSADADRRRALALEEHFDEELGPHIRVALFYDLLPDADTAVAAMTTEAGPTVRRVYRALFPLVRTAMMRTMRIDAASAALGRRKVTAALDRIEAEMQPSGYLVGNRFTIADLTAAALFSPLLAPPEFPYPLPALPRAAQQFRASLADRRGFTWLADVYRRHRGRSCAVPEASARP